MRNKIIITDENENIILEVEGESCFKVGEEIDIVIENFAPSVYDVKDKRIYGTVLRINHYFRYTYGAKSISKLKVTTVIIKINKVL